MIILATILSGVSLLMSLLFLIHLRSGPGWIVLFPKITAEGLSPFWAIMGAVGAVLGGLYQALWAIPIGIVGAGIMIWYVWKCTREHKGFEKAFGADWSDQLRPEQSKHMVQKRWTLFLKMKTFPEPAWERDVPFWTIPDTERKLLCDIWSPTGGNVSGLAFIYFHGGAWFIGDKDSGTRPFFRHLVAQGHTVMDVAYRLCPEVDIHGMIGDVKRAIAWMKTNAYRYGVNPEKIVLGGASAGGHLALLAGYAPQHPELTPEDVRSADLSVRGLISYYGPTDLLDLYLYMKYDKLTYMPPIPIGPDSTAKFSDYGRLDVLLGGWPQDAPTMYQLASPITHVHPGCPPTLLIQGDHDHVTSVVSTCSLHTKLIESGVPAINVIFPRTAHGFDLLIPHISPQSPPAQSALYDVDRFLALMTNGGFVK
jgi:acetyl esterase/lipase